MAGDFDLYEARPLIARSVEAGRRTRGVRIAKQHEATLGAKTTPMGRDCHALAATGLFQVRLPTKDAGGIYKCGNF